MFEIETDVPIPLINKGFASAIRKLKPGQSVHLPTSVNSVTTIARRCGPAGTFVARATDNGCRVWRVDNSGPTDTQRKMVEGGVEP